MKTVGHMYGHLTAIQFIRDDFTSGGQKRPVYLFRCECGKTVERRIYNVVQAKNPSCGCSARGTRTHGNSTGGKLTPEYLAWRCMLTRVKNPNIANADRYFGRGITVCPEWDSGGDGKGFERFLEYIGQKPSEKHSVDRKDNDLGYTPGNVRWATPSEQVLNRSNVRVFQSSIGTGPISVLAASAGIAPSIVLQRVNKLGWGIDRALTTKPKPDKRRMLCLYVPAQGV